MKYFKKLEKLLKAFTKPKQSQIVTGNTITGSVTQIQGGRDVHL